MKIEVIDGNIVIVIKATSDNFHNAKLSASGKTKVLATTHGFTGIMTPAGNVKLSLNATVDK